MAKKKSKKRIQVEKRANGLCEYCKSPISATTEPFVIEHIIPKSKNGSDEMTNLALSCSGCNGHKYDKTTGIDPKTKKVFPLFNPRTYRWNEHFNWSKDNVFVIGKTAIGRTTIHTLQLNRLPLQILRKAFIAFGIHPPK